MHRATVVSDPRSSQAAMTASSHPPIGLYHRIPVEAHQADATPPQVAARLIALLATS
jgi:hypothetical protein